MKKEVINVASTENRADVNIKSSMFYVPNSVNRGVLKAIGITGYSRFKSVIARDGHIEFLNSKKRMHRDRRIGIFNDFIALEGDLRFSIQKIPKLAAEVTSFNMLSPLLKSMTNSSRKKEKGKNSRILLTKTNIK